MTHEVTAVDVEAFGLRLTEALRPLLVGAPLVVLGEAEGVMASLARDVRQLGEARLAADPADRTGLAYVATAAAVQRVVDVLTEAPTAAPGSAPTPAGPARWLLVPLRLPDEVPIPSRAYHIAGTVTGMRDTLRHLRSSDVLQSSDWVRPGIAMYGSAPDYPAHTAADWTLQPAMTLEAKVIGVQQLQAGDSVGYGSSFTATGPMRVGTVACGYADGYPRVCPTGTPVLVDGVRSRTLGRVSMDMLAVDLTGLPDSGWGSRVTLWGRAANGAVLSIDEVAAQAGTLGYELMCALAQRVPVVVA